MSGAFCLTRWGFAAASFAVVSCGIARGAATYQTPEMLDFPSIFVSDLSPIHSEADLDDAAVTMIVPPTLDDELLSTDDLALELNLSEVGGSTMNLTSGLVLIDAGQTEASAGWNGLAESAAGWRAPRDESSSSSQALFFSAATTTDPGTTGFASNVSVIPLPAALTSAGVTVGLMAGVWIVRRVRKTRNTH